MKTSSNRPVLFFCLDRCFLLAWLFFLDVLVRFSFVSCFSFGFCLKYRVLVVPCFVFYQQVCFVFYVFFSSLFVKCCCSCFSLGRVRQIDWLIDSGECIPVDATLRIKRLIVPLPFFRSRFRFRSHLSDWKVTGAGRRRYRLTAFFFLLTDDSCEGTSLAKTSTLSIIGL